ncbi:MAG TPA: hypothetical protein P5034_05780 [Rectinema sp.]|nr:hypothetical protein [Rectinema sp.]
MPGFWETLSQTADRYNQIRADLEREQAELTSMLGNQLNTSYGNVMGGINLLGGLLGSKLGNMMSLYGTQVTQSESEKDRQNEFALAKLQADVDKEIARLQASNALAVEALRGKNHLQSLETQGAIERSNIIFNKYLTDQAQQELVNLYSASVGGNGVGNAFPSFSTKKRSAITKQGTYSAPVDAMGVNLNIPQSLYYNQKTKTKTNAPVFSLETADEAIKLANKYTVNEAKGTLIVQGNKADYEKLKDFYDAGILRYEPVYMPSVDEWNTLMKRLK